MGEEVEDVVARLRKRAGHFDGVARFSSWTDEIVQSELDAALTREAADAIESLRASLTRAEARWSALVENRDAWSEAARAAVAKVEEQFDIEQAEAA